VEAIDFLCSYQWPNGEKPGHERDVWRVAMQAILMSRSFWVPIEAGEAPDFFAEFLGHDGMSFAVSQAADAHDSLRDGAWKMRQEQRQRQIIRYVESIGSSSLPLSSPLSSKVKANPHAFAAVVMEIFADALVLAAWLVEVDFFAPLRTPSERAVQLQESVLALAPRGAGTL
jgi:hypothetical protein